MQAEPQPDPLAQALLTFALVVVCAGTLALFWHLPHTKIDISTRISLACLGAVCFGGGVGMVEIIARYRDDPMAAITTSWAFAYILLNALVAGGVFLLIITNRLPVVAGLFEREHVALNAAFTAGFGGMALLRASVANVRFRERTFQVGPALVLQVMMDFLEREVDRTRGRDRVNLVRTMLDGVIWSRASVLMPNTAQKLLQNFSAEEKGSFEAAVKAVFEAQGLPDNARLHQLGLVLIDTLGPRLFCELVTSLGASIRGPAPDDPTMRVFGRARSFTPHDLPAILATCRALVRDRSGRLPAEPRDSLFNWKALFDEAAAPEDDLPDDARITDSNRVVMGLAALRSHFGMETLALALEALFGARAERGADHSDDDLPTEPDRHGTGPAKPGGEAVAAPGTSEGQAEESEAADAPDPADDGANMPGADANPATATDTSSGGVDRRLASDPLVQAAGGIVEQPDAGPADGTGDSGSGAQGSPAPRPQGGAGDPLG